MEKEVHQCEEDNTQYDILQKFLTLLQGHMMLETFKKQKIVRYIQMLKVVAYKEVHNSGLIPISSDEFDIHQFGYSIYAIGFQSLI